MKKIVVFTLTAGIALALFAGCAAKDARTSDANTSGTASSTVNANDKNNGSDAKDDNRDNDSQYQDPENIVFEDDMNAIIDLPVDDIKVMFEGKELLPGRDTAEVLQNSFPDTFEDSSRFNINRWKPEYSVGADAELTASDSSDDYKTETEPDLQDVVPTLYVFDKLGTLVPTEGTQFDFIGITEDASFDDVLETMDKYGKPYYGHNYTKETADEAGSGSGILSYLTSDGYKIEFYFDGYGKYMHSVHIAYTPGELSYREGMAKLQSN